MEGSDVRTLAYILPPACYGKYIIPDEGRAAQAVSAFIRK